MKRLDLVFIISSIVLFLLLNWSALNAYFSQDDFYHLRQVMGKKTYDFFSLFLPWNEVGFTFYRPLSREIPNFLMLNIFGLNAIWYHLLNFLLIILNGFFLIKLLGFFKVDRFLKKLAFFIYLINPIHGIELYYLSSLQTLLSTTFILLALIYFYRYTQLKDDKFNYLSVGFFALAVYSHESAIIFIPIIFVLKFFLKPEEIKSYLLSILNNFRLYIAVVIPRILIYFYNLGLPKQEVYKPSFFFGDIINTYSWYFLWTLGLPEMLTDFMTLKLNFNPNFFRFYNWYADLVFPLLILLILVLFYLFLRVVFVYEVRSKIILFGLFYLISLGPFVFFPNHKFVYYLTLPLVFFSCVVAILVGESLKNLNTAKIVLGVVVFIITIISLNTTSLNSITHWSAKRAQAAQFLVNQAQSTVLVPEKESVFYIVNDPEYPFISKEWGTSSKQAFYILSGSDAFQLLYKDPTLNVFYEDINKGYQHKNMNKLYLLKAKFPY